MGCEKLVRATLEHFSSQNVEQSPERNAIERFSVRFLIPNATETMIRSISLTFILWKDGMPISGISQMSGQ